MNIPVIQQIRPAACTDKRVGFKEEISYAGPIIFAFLFFYFYFYFIFIFILFYFYLYLYYILFYFIYIYIYFIFIFIFIFFYLNLLIFIYQQHLLKWLQYTTLSSIKMKLFCCLFVQSSLFLFLICF